MGDEVLVHRDAIGFDQSHNLAEQGASWFVGGCLLVSKYRFQKGIWLVDQWIIIIVHHQLTRMFQGMSEGTIMINLGKSLSDHPFLRAFLRICSTTHLTPTNHWLTLLKIQKELFVISPVKLYVCIYVFTPLCMTQMTSVWITALDHGIWTGEESQTGDTLVLVWCHTHNEQL